MPTRPQTTVAIANARTMLLSYLNVSTCAPEPPTAFCRPFELSRRNASLISHLLNPFELLNASTLQRPSCSAPVLCSLHESRCSLAAVPFPSPPLEERGRERRALFSARTAATLEIG